jgi:hypothetical protein
MQRFGQRIFVAQEYYVPDRIRARAVQPRSGCEREPDIEQLFADDCVAHRRMIYLWF